MTGLTCLNQSFMTRSDREAPVINFLDFFRFMEEDGTVTAYYGGADGHFNPEVVIF